MLVHTTTFSYQMLHFIKHIVHQMAKVPSGALALLVLLLPLSCRKEKTEITKHDFNIDSAYSMLTRDVNVLISDSGMTKYRLKAAEWYIYEKVDRPYWYFPKGFYSEQMDLKRKPIAQVKSDTAYYYFREEVWHLVGNVLVYNLAGDKFSARSLTWKKQADMISSDDTVTIETQGRMLKGSHFISNQDFTKYTFYNSRGSMDIKEEEENVLSPNTTTPPPPATTTIPATTTPIAHP